MNDNNENTVLDQTGNNKIKKSDDDTITLYDINSLKPEEDMPYIYCPTCGKKVVADSMFCSSCGYQVDTRSV